MIRSLPGCIGFCTIGMSRPSIPDEVRNHNSQPRLRRCVALVYPQACAVCGRSVESRHDGVACEVCWTATHLLGKMTRCAGSADSYYGFDYRDRRSVFAAASATTTRSTPRGPADFMKEPWRASILELKPPASFAQRLRAFDVDTLQRRRNSADLIIRFRCILRANANAALIKLLARPRTCSPSVFRSTT